MNLISDLTQLFNNDIQSMMYSRSRLEYDQNVVSEILKFWQNFNTNKPISKSLNIIDVGCGTGQLTKELVPYASSLLGIDVSESQIKEAQKVSHENLQYIVGSCYELPVPDNSIDLLTAAFCVHWFDIDKFYAEADRCLKRNGVLAIISHRKGYFVADEKNYNLEELNQFITQDLWNDEKYFGSCVVDKVEWACNLLPDLKMLYPDTAIRNENLNIQYTQSLHRYREFLLSLSLYQLWKKANPNARDVVEAAMEKILFCLGNPESGLDTKLPIRHTIGLIMCSKP